MVLWSLWGRLARDPARGMGEGARRAVPGSQAPVAALRPTAIRAGTIGGWLRLVPEE